MGKAVKKSDAEVKKNVQVREPKEKAISLDEIKETLENKVDENQKRTIAKEVLINIGIAMVMVAFLAIVTIGKANIEQDILAQDIKIIALCVMATGIILLEESYKKDNLKLVMNSIETIVFAAVNLCLVYVVKLYFEMLNKVTLYVAIGIAVYYILKSIVLTIINTRKFKEQNNDIKDII